MVGPRWGFDGLYDGRVILWGGSAAGLVGDPVVVQAGDDLVAQRLLLLIVLCERKTILARGAVAPVRGHLDSEHSAHNAPSKIGHGLGRPASGVRRPASGCRWMG